AHQQFGRIPPRHQLMPMRPKHPPQRLGVARKLVPQFHPRKPGLPRLGQAHLQRRLPADLDHVIIGPPDWVRAYTDHLPAFVLLVSRCRLPYGDIPQRVTPGSSRGQVCAPPSALSPLPSSPTPLHLRLTSRTSSSVEYHPDTNSYPCAPSIPATLELRPETCSPIPSPKTRPPAPRPDTPSTTSPRQSSQCHTG